MDDRDPRAWWERRYRSETGAPPGPTPFGLRCAGEVPSLAARLGRAPEILELGAGSGRDTRVFLKAGAWVTATDFAAAGLRLVGLIPGVAALRADLREPLPFADGSFDAVYSHLVLSCDFRDDAVARIVGEVHRVLRPRGALWLAVRSTDDPIYQRGPQRGAGYFALGDSGLHFFSRRTLRSFLAGFECLELRSEQPEIDGERYGILEVSAVKSAGVIE